MSTNANKKWILPIVAVLGIATQARATIWYSSFDPWNSAVAATSRVDGFGNPALRQVFNTFNLFDFKFLSYIHFYAPAVAPMYAVELRVGGPNSTAIYRRMPANPLLVQSHPTFGNKVTIAVPRTLLWHGTWSISVATDSRFSTVQGFWTPDFCPGWTLSISPITGGIVFSETSGLMIQLADSL